MLQQFANYIFSSITNTEIAPISTPEESAESNTPELTSIETDDEWVLIDRERRDSEGNSEFSSVESLDVDDVDIDDPIQDHDHAISDSDSDDDISIVQNIRSYSNNNNNVRSRSNTTTVSSNNSGGINLADLLARSNRDQASSSFYSFSTGMEESWFITPPPCFISTGPVHMETSPLENLLIEHPSMSVYKQHGRRHQRVCHPIPPQTPEQRVVQRNTALVKRIRQRQQPPRQIIRNPRERRVNNLPLVKQHEQQAVRQTQAQKIQIKQSSKNSQRNYLDRNNKAREVNCRNRRQRRGERSQGAQRSFANNNRKC